MTKMLLMLEKHDVFYADFHGENLMLKESNELVLTDFGAAARITDRSGNINPKGFCSNFIKEKFEERNQSPVAFKYRLMNEHYAKQLLSHFKLIEQCVEEKDEFMEAFADLNKFIEKELRTNEDYEYTEAK